MTKTLMDNKRIPHYFEQDFDPEKLESCWFRYEFNADYISEPIKSYRIHCPTIRPEEK